MARIKQMPARFGAAPPLVAPLLGTGPERDRNRAARVNWRAWYDTAEWKRLRDEVFLDALFTCAICGTAKADPANRKGMPGLICDHKVPHRGERALFFMRSNLQCLCKPCHDRIKQREERRERL